MSWLLRDGEVLASLEVAESRPARTRGLLGRRGIEGTILLRPARSVHSLGMRFPIDVAFLDRELRVVRIISMKRWRVSRPVARAHAVLEAERGAFRSWELRPGDQLEIKE
ncbi:MAG: DUF192 domain-containing protein [Acidimicrobiales bacterium]